MRTPPLAEVVGRNRYGRSLLGGKSRLTCESLQGPEDQKGVLILDHVHSRCQALIRDASAGARQFEALKRLVALQGHCERRVRRPCSAESRSGQPEGQMQRHKHVRLLSVGKACPEQTLWTNEWHNLFENAAKVSTSIAFTDNHRCESHC